MDAKALCRYIFPAVGGLFATYLYNVVDGIFVGQGVGRMALGAVNIGVPFITSVVAVAAMFPMGGATVVAIRMGRGDREGANQAFLTALGLTLAGGPLLGALGANAEVLPHARAYLSILALGAPAMLFSVSAATLLRADGAIRRGLAGNLAGSVTNMVLDPVFILGFRWGIAGAAAGTVLGNLVACAIYLEYILRRSRTLSLAPADALRHPARLGRVLALGLPNGVSSLLAGLAGSFSNRMLAGYGTAALAAMAAADKATMVVSLVQMGICMGVQPLLAYNVGARDRPRLQAALTRLAGLTFGFGAVFMAACLLGQNALLGLFLSDAGALALGRSLLPWLLAASPLLGLYYLSTNFLQAMGRAAGATVLSALRQGVLLIPALYLFHGLLGLPGLAAARAAADLASVLIALCLLTHAWRNLARQR